MIKIEKLNIRKTIFEIILLSLVFFTLFVPNKYSKEALTLTLLVCAIVSFVLFKKAESFSINNKKVVMQLLAFACIYVVGNYFIGIYVGFYKNPVSVNIGVQIRYTVLIAIIIILSEYIRSLMISKKEKLSATIITLSFIVIDIVLYAQLYDITKLEDFVSVLGLVIFASIAENLLFNYVSVRFGKKPIIIYRLITVLYMYLIPILPEIYTYFKAVMKILYPYLIFLFLENSYTAKKMMVSRTTRTRRVVSSLIVVVIGVAITLLVSCKFYFGIIAVGSNSMKGTIDKGDAVLFVKYTDQKLRVGEVIIFKKNNLSLIHRITNIENVNNELRYTTKGDNNDTEDPGYITNIDVMGISKQTIKYIGYPSILLGEIFNSIKK